MKLQHCGLVESVLDGLRHIFAPVFRLFHFFLFQVDVYQAVIFLGEDRVSLSIGLRFLYATKTKNTQGFIRDFGGILLYGKSSPFSALQTS